MTAAVETLAALHARGFQVLRDGYALRLRGPSRLDDAALRAALGAHKADILELLALEWDEAAAAAAFADTLYRLRDVAGATGDQESADLWEALNTAWFACDRVAFEVALRALETYTLDACPVGASAVLDALRRRGLSVTVTTADDGRAELVVRGSDIPPLLLSAIKDHHAELIDLVTALPEAR